ncbi:exopolyphosphatase [Arthrobacter sp.]|uniref:Ppx/GppA phosphatase family protein n=1 Tax=Arthrobacter sp. TaxID=1667 RepID=UPI003A9501FC
MRVAGIDCGTNSIRLLIADVIEDEDGDVRLLDIAREMRIVRLGQGVDATGNLAPEALERTFAAVDEYAALIGAHGAQHVRFVATSATRDAGNRAEFMVGVRDRLGVEPEVIEGSEEAELSFAGAVSVRPPADGEDILVVDLGGGSTEFVVGNAQGVRGAISINMGCVRYSERFLTDDPPTAEQVAAAEAEANHQLDTVFAALPIQDVDRVVGVAGTITTVTAHVLDLHSYQPEAIDGSELPVGVIEAAASEFLSFSRRRREQLPYMHPGRVDVIAAGSLIYRTILLRVAEATGNRVRTAVASEHDILDGIALGLAGH